MPDEVSLDGAGVERELEPHPTIVVHNVEKAKRRLIHFFLFIINTTPYYFNVVNPIINFVQFFTSFKLCIIKIYHN